MSQHLIELMRSLDTLAIKAIQERLTTEAIETGGEANFDQTTKINLHGINIANDNPIIAISHFLEVGARTVETIELCTAAETRLKQPCIQTGAMTKDCELILKNSRCPHQRKTAEDILGAIRNAKAVA